jgi:hypothetical protein
MLNTKGGNIARTFPAPYSWSWKNTSMAATIMNALEASARKIVFTLHTNFTTGSLTMAMK